MQRGRSVGAPVAPAVKLAIPKPVNLPSLRKVRLLLCDVWLLLRFASATPARGRSGMHAGERGQRSQHPDRTHWKQRRLDKAGGARSRFGSRHRGGPCCGCCEVGIGCRTERSSAVAAPRCVCQSAAEPRSQRRLQGARTSRRQAPPQPLRVSQPRCDGLREGRHHGTARQELCLDLWPFQQGACSSA